MSRNAQESQRIARSAACASVWAGVLACQLAPAQAARRAWAGLALLPWLAASLPLPAAAPLTAPPSLPQARVVIVHEPRAMEAFTPLPDVVRDMVERGLLAHTGKTNLVEAWRGVVKTNDVVGLKVFSGPGHTSGTRPTVVAAVIEGLLAAGVPPRNVILWDKQLADLRAAGFSELGRRYGVRVVAASTAWDARTYYENSLLGNLVWGDLEFGRKGDAVGRKSHVAAIVAKEITRHISIAPLMNHNLAGVSGHCYSLALGSVDNTLRFESTARALSEAVPEILALPVLFDRLALCITDALICQYQGEHLTRLHYAAPLAQLRFSQDPVALDTLSLAELEGQRQKASLPSAKFSAELYKNAALLELGVVDARQIRVQMK